VCTSVGPCLVRTFVYSARHPTLGHFDTASRTRPLAKDLGVSRSCLQNWLRQADADDNRGAGDRLTSAEKKELAELRRRNKQLEMENDILKRAAAYFARENVLPK